MSAWDVLLIVAAAIGGAAVGARFAARGIRRGEQGVASRPEPVVPTPTLGDDRGALERILSAMEEGVVLFDGSGDRIYANPALERHLGVTPDRTETILPLGVREAAASAAGGASVRVDVETGSPSRWLRAAASPVSEDGDVLIVIRDVTEARQLDAVRRDFVANASHELKSPVASIRAAAETLRDGAIEDPPAAIRFTEQLEREAVRLSRIVTDLLDLSRLESGSGRDERVRLDRLALEEAARLQERASNADVTLQVHADGLPAIAGSGRDLRLLVANLIENAIDYTPPGGRIDVELRAEPERVVLSVRDSGIGIPGRDLPRIFERFYRVDRARSRETGGTGLGLAIVKHVAENHGGTVDVESELGRGTSFEVSLPRHKERPDAP